MFWHISAFKYFLRNCTSIGSGRQVADAGIISNKSPTVSLVHLKGSDRQRTRRYVARSWHLVCVITMNPRIFLCLWVKYKFSSLHGLSFARDSQEMVKFTLLISHSTSVGTFFCCDTSAVFNLGALPAFDSISQVFPVSRKFSFQSFPLPHFLLLTFSLPLVLFQSFPYLFWHFQICFLL